MNCKNCNFGLNDKDNFCVNCGAKIIRKRITVKGLFSNLLDALGWDSNFLVTLRFLIYRPQIVIREYIDGARKKYANPFAFFAITVALSLFVFNQFSEELYELSSELNFQQPDFTDNTATNDSKGFMFGFKDQKEFNDAVMTFQMKYYNIISFLFLPLFTLFSFLVFRKPHNFGEHLIINTYIQGIVSFLGVVLFIISLISNINLYTYGTFILPFLFYPYVYKKLNNYTIGQTLLKILKFIGILLGIFLVFAIIILIIVYFSAMISKSL